MSINQVQDGAADRPVLTEVAGALEQLSRADLSKLWALGEAEVTAVFGALERLRARVDAAQVAVMAEVRSRGMGSEAGWGPVDWAVRAAPGLPAQRASELDQVAAAGGDQRLAELVAGVATAELPLSKAAQIVRFHREVRPLADPEALAGAVSALVDGARGSGGLTARQLAMAIRHAGQLLKPARDLEHDEARRRAARGLYKSIGPVGMSTYRLVLDPEGAAILDAAVDPLARPRRDPLSHERDPRTPAARRADALLAVIGRGVGSPGEAPTTARTSVVVTIGLQDLLDGLRGRGVTLGQEVLSPATVRRMACDAALIPMVLGTRGEALDVGRAKRLVTPAIRLAAWHRDGGCSYPGCSVPAQWCDAHHVVPWWAGGATSLANTAMLCGRHHTLVHTQSLTCTVSDTEVTWHR